MELFAIDKNNKKMHGTANGYENVLYYYKGTVN